MRRHVFLSYFVKTVGVALLPFRFVTCVRKSLLHSVLPTFSENQAARLRTINYN